MCRQIQNVHTNTKCAHKYKMCTQIQIVRTNTKCAHKYKMCRQLHRMCLSSVLLGIEQIERGTWDGTWHCSPRFTFIANFEIKFNWVVSKKTWGLKMLLVSYISGSCGPVDVRESWSALKVWSDASVEMKKSNRTWKPGTLFPSLIVWRPLYVIGPRICTTLYFLPALAALSVLPTLGADWI